MTATGRRILWYVAASVLFAIALAFSPLIPMLLGERSPRVAGA